MNTQIAINEYLEWKASYAVPASKSYLFCLKKLAELYKGKLEDLTIIDIARFIQLQSLKLSPHTVVYYVDILKDFFSYHRTQVNPKLIRAPKFTPAPRNYVKQEEFEKMSGSLNEWEYYDLQKKVILHLLWHTGIRVSELCDLDTLDIENSKNSARIITKKNKKERFIMWSGEAHQLLMRYIGTRICLNQRPELFSISEGRITTRTIERWVKNIAKANGLRHIHPHMFRHGKAHYMLSHGAQLIEVKEVLGHTSIVSTQDYIGLFPEEFEQMASKYISC